MNMNIYMKNNINKNIALNQDEIIGTRTFEPNHVLNLIFSWLLKRETN